MKPPFLKPPTPQAHGCLQWIQFYTQEVRLAFSGAIFYDSIVAAHLGLSWHPRTEFLYQEQETVWGSLYYGSMGCPLPCVLVNSGVP